MGKIVKNLVLGFVVLFVVIQFYRPERSNPPVTAEIEAPPPVKSILKKSCYDCHSNETRWPWYSNISPVSWFVARHVAGGRKHLNFSEWGNLTEKKRQKKIEEIEEEVKDGNMPLPSYLILHRGARLSTPEKETLFFWLHSLQHPEQNKEEELRNIR